MRNVGKLRTFNPKLRTSSEAKSKISKRRDDLNAIGRQFMSNVICLRMTFDGVR